MKCQIRLLRNFGDNTVQDFDLMQIKKLLNKDTLSVIPLYADGDYWVRQDEFCNKFKIVPLTDDIIVYVQSVGLSLTFSLVVPAIEKMIDETGRKPESVYIFSPNSILSDCSWKNLFWEYFKVSSEFSRSKDYWSNPTLLETCTKPWSVFTDTCSTPRLLALYDICNDPILKQNFLVNLDNTPTHNSLLVFDQTDKIHDSIDYWIPVPPENKMQRIMKHNNFREFCQRLPNEPNTQPGEYLFELVFETVTRGFTFSPGQKTISTIISEKPFLVYAPPNFLENLRKIGFKTFDALWDESYDLLEGIDRYCAIIDVAKKVSSLPKEQQFEMYTKSRDICIHNKKILKSYILNNNTSHRIEQVKLNSVRYAP